MHCQRVKVWTTAINFDVESEKVTPVPLTMSVFEVSLEGLTMKPINYLILYNITCIYIISYNYTAW